MLAVKGIYDKGIVQIKETVPDFEKCEVIVTFLPTTYKIEQNNNFFLSEPKLNSLEKKKIAIDSLLGICEGNILTLDDIKQERLAKQ